MWKVVFNCDLSSRKIVCGKDFVSFNTNWKSKIKIENMWKIKENHIYVEGATG